MLLMVATFPDPNSSTVCIIYPHVEEGGHRESFQGHSFPP